MYEGIVRAKKHRRKHAQETFFNETELNNDCGHVSISFSTTMYTSTHSLSLTMLLIPPLAEVFDATEAGVKLGVVGGLERGSRADVLRCMERWAVRGRTREGTRGWSRVLTRTGG